MKVRLKKDRPFVLLLAAATLLHVLALLLPVAQRAIVSPAKPDTVQVRLQRPPAVTAEAPETGVDTLPEPAPQPVPLERPVPLVESRPTPALAESAAPHPTPQPAPEQSPPETRPDSSRVLSWQFDYESKAPVFGSRDSRPGDPAEFHLRARPGLDEVLNAPSLQLPFADTRIYLVDSYSPGIGGSVERFFDGVTVPFGFTTKSNTRVQCAWVLVFAGCNWGHISLFERKARLRNPERDN